MAWKKRKAETNELNFALYRGKAAAGSDGKSAFPSLLSRARYIGERCRRILFRQLDCSWPDALDIFSDFIAEQLNRRRLMNGVPIELFQTHVE